MQDGGHVQVENLSIALRKRSNWEAIDLGFALARQWFMRLWGAWIIGALPVFIITMILTYSTENETLRIFLFILFWWGKPLYEQPLLFILSRQLFSEPVSLRDVLKDYFKIIKPQLAALLLWRRLSLSRSFNNPVAMLENLKGKERRSRLNVLHAQQSSAAQWLTIICVHIEYLLYTSLLLFLFALIPSELNDDLSLLEWLGGEGSILLAVNNIAYFICISIMAPIYVASGFALYITRRIKLEGWDIELGFKRMKNRLENNTASIKHNNGKSPNAILVCLPLLSCLLAFSLLPSNSHAQEILNIDKNDAKTAIEEVLKHEDFGKTITKKELTFVGTNSEDEDDETPQWLKDFFEWLFGNLGDEDVSTGFKIIEIIIWLAIAGFIVWLISKYSHWLNWITLPSQSANNQTTPIPNKILGMEMSKNTLPRDILATFSNLINNKQYREALSLLYRATLSSIVHHGDIEIPVSATEQECATIVSQKRNENESMFFKSLTHAWIMLAYADQEPSKETLTNLREGWSNHYAFLYNQDPS